MKTLPLVLLIFAIANAFAQIEPFDPAILPQRLDAMLENHYKPSVTVAFGSFTYADTQVPTPFSRWIEDELRLACPRTTRLKLFDKQVGAAVDPSIRAQYEGFFGSDRVDSIMYGTFVQGHSDVAITLTLTDLATGSIIASSRLQVKQSALPPELSVAPTVKTMQMSSALSSLTSVDKGLSLTLTTDRGPGATYRDGESLTLLVSVNRNAYLKLYHIDVNGVAQLIWPNRFGGSGRIAKGEALHFPDGTDGFKYLIGPPFGTEYIKAVASTVPFASMEPDFTDLSGTAVSAITQGLGVVAKGELARAEALVVYEVLPKR